MPSPLTTDLPRPKSWDEFEDICADVLKELWADPYVTRNGRSGQGRHCVDTFGLPRHLGGASGKMYAGAQCKKMDELTIKVVQNEVNAATKFRPKLTEYLIMTTAARDAKLQEKVRTESWPFERVHVMFWDDISLELSGHEDLLQKHFPNWMKRTTTEEQVLNMVLSSEPGDYRYDDYTGVFYYTSDISLRIEFERDKEWQEDFHEPWVKKFPDGRATRQPVYIYYGQTRIKEVPCVYVDGGRHVIPFPRSATDLTLTRFRYHIGRILNHYIPGSGFDFALKQAGILVRDGAAKPPNSSCDFSRGD